MSETTRSYVIIEMLNNARFFGAPVVWQPLPFMPQYPNTPEGREVARRTMRGAQEHYGWKKGDLRLAVITVTHKVIR